MKFQLRNPQSVAKPRHEEDGLKVHQSGRRGETVLRHRHGAGADSRDAIVLDAKCKKATRPIFAKQTLARNVVVGAAECHCRLRFQ